MIISCQKWQSSRVPSTPRHPHGGKKEDYMKRTATLNSGTMLELECSAATPIIYKRLWHENIITGFQEIAKDNTDELLEFMEKVVYTFAKNAELGTAGILRFENKVEDFVDFLAQFEILELASGNILDVILEMWGMNTETTSEPKNQQSPQQENTL